MTASSAFGGRSGVVGPARPRPERSRVRVRSLYYVGRAGGTYSVLGDAPTRSFSDRPAWPERSAVVSRRARFGAVAEDIVATHESRLRQLRPSLVPAFSCGAFVECCTLHVLTRSLPRIRIAGRHLWLRPRTSHSPRSSHHAFLQRWTPRNIGKSPWMVGSFWSHRTRPSPPHRGTFQWRFASSRSLQPLRHRALSGRVQRAAAPGNPRYSTEPERFAIS